MEKTMGGTQVTEELISIVLPIYNVEKYLERCIKSVVNQSYHNLEIILVDDGSSDQCPHLCEEWAKKDNRIKVIHKENAGLGMARNTGIENATGEYICFFDSDDYVALDTVEKCYRRAKEEKADIVTFGFCNVKNDGRTERCVIPHTNKQTYRNDEVQETFLPDLIAPDTATGKSAGLWMSACASFYSIELIRRTGWKFVSEREIISEDIYSLLLLYKEVKCVSVVSGALYFYCENEESLTHTYRKDRYEKIKHFYDSCIQAADECGYSQGVKTRLTYPYISNTISALKMIVTSDCDKIEKKKEFIKIVADSHIQRVLNGICIDGESLSRKLFLHSIKRKYYGLCYLMIKAKA
ncbi:MAG: glycosyltransferase family 2 protein [Ruminococcus flavefaciens]|nr:glycosyltransferase family 2 protein [Ruminococcus flavefaciens]